MLGFESVEEALVAEPREMVSVSPELWQTLRDIHRGGALRQEFQAAWANGRAFLRAEDALRMRRPTVIEWKGAIRAPGDEVVPADLRIDHVYLVSCKYLSRIVLNASPAHIFDRLLAGGHGQRGDDWYRVVAEDLLEDLYRAAVSPFATDFPSALRDLSAEQRRSLAGRLRGRWSEAMSVQARSFARVVAERSAERWRDALAVSGAQERFLWRLLRIGSAPYFVLGTDHEANLRLRIETPWDWKQRYRLASFEVEPADGGQPVVGWVARIEHTRSRLLSELRGHVEVRWSHGKFNGPPEAKVYLDTPHHEVPGYVALT